jgi:hypothetical protein
MARAPWRLVVFGGDCDLTPARLVVHETDAGAGLYLAPGMIAACIAGSGWLSKIGIAGTGQCRAARGSMFGSSNTVRGRCTEPQLDCGMGWSCIGLGTRMGHLACLLI